MKKLLTIGLTVLYLIALPLSNVHAQAVATPASTYFDPGNGSVVYINDDDEFDVDVVINTGGANSAGADSFVTFNSSEVQFVSGVYPSSSIFYPNIFVVSMPSASTANANEIIKMSRTISAPAEGEDPDYTNGTGTFATLTFQALVDVGETVTFDFESVLGSTEDTNVAGDALGTDILGQASPSTLTIARDQIIIEDDPYITSIQPMQGDEGTNVIVHIYGRNFDSVEGNVHIGTWSSSVMAWTDTDITITVIGRDVFVDQNTQYPVKVTRADGKEAIYNGYTFVDTGLPLIIWLGFVPLNGVLALLVKRKWFT